jgi:hypothetical protein
MAGVKAMTDIVVRRPASECDEALAKTILLPVASATNPDPDLACDAAVALSHWGSFDGIGEVMKRISTDRRGGSRLCYKTVCLAAHKLPGGFAGLPPEKFNQATEAERSAAMTELQVWWDKAKGGKPETSIFDELKAAGVTIPKDVSPSNKETISALIAGLEVPNRLLRYACLDLLVKRTGKIDLAKDFKKCTMGGGAQARVGFSEEEPAQGYPEGSPKATALYDQQKERAKKWKTWWDNAHATYSNGVWK